MWFTCKSLSIFSVYEFANGSSNYSSNYIDTVQRTYLAIILWTCRFIQARQYLAF